MFTKLTNNHSSVNPPYNHAMYLCDTYAELPTFNVTRKKRNIPVGSQAVVTEEHMIYIMTNSGSWVAFKPLGSNATTVTSNGNGNTDAAVTSPVFVLDLDFSAQEEKTLGLTGTGHESWGSDTLTVSGKLLEGFDTQTHKAIVASVKVPTINFEDKYSEYLGNTVDNKFSLILSHVSSYSNAEGTVSQESWRGSYIQTDGFISGGMLRSTVKVELFFDNTDGSCVSRLNRDLLYWNFE